MPFGVKNEISALIVVRDSLKAFEKINNYKRFQVSGSSHGIRQITLVNALEQVLLIRGFMSHAYGAKYRCGVIRSLLRCSKTSSTLCAMRLAPVLSFFLLVS